MLNMCDGCQSGMPLNKHNMHVDSNGLPVMMCTKNWYKGEDDVHSKRNSRNKGVPTKR